MRYFELRYYYEYLSFETNSNKELVKNTINREIIEDLLKRRVFLINHAHLS